MTELQLLSSPAANGSQRRRAMPRSQLLLDDVLQNANVAEVANLDDFGSHGRTWRTYRLLCSRR